MCPTSKTKYWKFFFNLKDDKCNLKKTNIVKAHKALYNYAWHAQISNTRCPARQLLTGFQLSTSRPTNTGCWHPPQSGILKNQAKCVWSFWGDRRLVVEFGQWPKVGQARTQLGKSWSTTLSPNMAPAYHFLACFNTRYQTGMQLSISPQPAYVLPERARMLWNKDHGEILCEREQGTMKHKN